MPDAVRRLLAQQDGVVSRRQVLGAGLGPGDIERLLRRRRWVRLMDGVYLDHTGCPTWRQRAWAGVLVSWPAALRGLSAVHAVDRSVEVGGLVHVAVDRARTRPTPRQGYEVRRVADLAGTVQWNANPPRQRYEEAVIDVAAEARDDLAAVAVLTAACSGRFTTAARLRAALAARSRVARRPWLAAVLADIEAGACSVLEHGYLTRVERPHGLPAAARQLRQLTDAGVVYRDVGYDGGVVVVELDGRVFHADPSQRGRDLRRDLLLAAGGGATVRLGWGQVFAEQCETAGALARVLERHGVAVGLRPCGPGCRAGALSPRA